MTKNLSKPLPQRNLDEKGIQKYVKEGLGEDTLLKKTLNTDKIKTVDKVLRESPEMSRLTIDLPKETHIDFKIACARLGRKMNEEMRDLVEQRIRELSE